MAKNALLIPLYNSFLRRKKTYVTIARGNIMPIKRAQAMDSERGLPRFRVSRKTQMADPTNKASNIILATIENVIGPLINT